jgi:hypothetical protein
MKVCMTQASGLMRCAAVPIDVVLVAGNMITLAGCQSGGRTT